MEPDQATYRIIINDVTVLLTSHINDEFNMKFFQLFPVQTNPLMKVFILIIYKTCQLRFKWHSLWFNPRDRFFSALVWKEENPSKSCNEMLNNDLQPKRW